MKWTTYVIRFLIYFYFVIILTDMKEKMGAINVELVGKQPSRYLKI